MTGLDADTAELLTLSLRRAVQGRDPATVDAALAEVGWRDALGGDGTTDDATAAAGISTGAGIAVVALLFAEQGAANASSGAIDDLLTAAVGLPPEDTAFVLPVFGEPSAPGRSTSDGLTVRGLGTARMTRASRAVVVVPAGDGFRAATVAAGHLRRSPIGGVDPSLGLVTVEADGVPASDWTEADWPGLVAVGQVALSFELIGASRTMLRLAREHALTRIQFGQPISAFQAVRHRLAECLIAIEGADAAATGAIESADPLRPGSVSPLLAGIAKAVAGRAARTVARHCQQVLAGVGFTQEHDLHHFFRRTLVLNNLLGDPQTLTRTLGTRLLQTRQIPPTPPL